MPPEALIVVTDRSHGIGIGFDSVARVFEAPDGASGLERSRAELSPSGNGIHWPLVDEDLAAGPLLQAAA
jgi:hypothetical protein